VAYRLRERLVLGSGLVAVAAVAAASVAAIAGAHPGNTVGRLVGSVVVLYLCARMWGHGSTLQERGRQALLARIARLGAPIVLALLLLQTWATEKIRLSLGQGAPVVHVTTLTRLEWSADVAAFALFLLTAMTVWIERSTRVAAWCCRVAEVLVVFLAVDLLGAVWRLYSLGPQWRLVTALVVLSLAGTVVVGTLRRIERLDEVTPETSAT
jgi:hypothetical protein